MSSLITTTTFTNDGDGWRDLSQRTYMFPARQLAAICQWNDPNGDWSYADMRDEGLTVPEIRDICREQIAAWAADLAD